MRSTAADDGSLNLAIPVGSLLVEWGQRFVKFAPASREFIRLPFALRHDACLGQLGQALAEDRGRHPIASRLERAKPEGLIPQFPEDAECPAAAEEIEQGHDR